MQPGTETFTMNMGKIVPVRIIKRVEPIAPVDTEYLVEYIGTERVCLDWGQNWFLNPGTYFRTRPINIDRAMMLKSGGY